LVMGTCFQGGHKTIQWQYILVKIKIRVSFIQNESSQRFVFNGIDTGNIRFRQISNHHYWVIAVLLFYRVLIPIS
jgi:hypothetical protein